MRKVEVIVDGKSYPCRTTMGAMLRFKRETGKEVTEISDWEFTDLCTFLWCCVVSASKHDGVEFDMSLLDFADCITPSELSEWTASIKEEAPEAQEGEEEEKKRQE